MTCILAVGAGSGNALALNNAKVDSLWRQKTISVKNGGQAPDVMTLLRAFNEALPTWVVGEVLEQQKKPVPGTKRNGTTLLYENNQEDELRILIDPKNGYACYESLTDVDQMSCCVWRRSNGHRIFAISLYEQHVMPQNLLCWYDYDPQTQTMKPERCPLDDYKKPSSVVEVGWTLPEKGTDFIINEYSPFYPNVRRIYKWDGMKPQFSRIQMEDFEYQEFGDGEWTKASGEGFKDVAFVDLDGYPLLCLRKAKDSEDQERDDMLILAEFKGKMLTVAISDTFNRIRGFFHVKPEQDAPWTGEEVVAYTSDMMHTNYFVVVKEGLIRYIIIHASVADHVEIDPQWVPFEFYGQKE